MVAGEAWETSGPVTEIAARPLYLDVSLSPGASFVQSVPSGHTALAYIFAGTGRFGVDGEMVEATRLAVFGDGDQIEVHSEAGMRFMLIAGEPFREPIAPYGPFVMNTFEERGGTKWDRAARYLKIATVLHAHGEVGIGAQALADRAAAATRLTAPTCSAPSALSVMPGR